MSSLPIDPDESGDVPRCSQRCLHAVGQSFDTYITCAIGDREQLRGSPCLPRIRELVAISRRRCDGCHRYVEDARAYPSDGRCSKRGCTTMAHDCCSRWEAKR